MQNNIKLIQKIKMHKERGPFEREDDLIRQMISSKLKNRKIHKTGHRLAVAFKVL